MVRTFEDATFQDNGLFGLVPTIEQAVEIIAFRRFESIGLDFHGPPDHQGIDAVKTLILGSKLTLLSMDLGSLSRYGYGSDLSDTDHLRTLLRCVNVIEQIVSIQHVDIYSLYVDDSILKALCSHQSIKTIRSEPATHSFVTSSGIDCLLQCPHLVMVDIDSNLLTETDRNRLLKRFPNLNLLSPCAQNQPRTGA